MSNTETKPTPLFIGTAERAALQALRQLAIKNPVDVSTLLAQVATPEGMAAHRAHMRRQTVLLPVKFTVTFTVEANHPGGTARHMSLCSNQPGMAPRMEAVAMVADELGFEIPITMGSMERLEGGCIAAHVLQLVGSVAPTRMQ